MHKYIHKHLIRWRRIVCVHHTNTKLIIRFIFALMVVFVCTIAAKMYIGTNLLSSCEKQFEYQLLNQTVYEELYITRPSGRDDGEVVRVMFVIASTRIDWMLCYTVASAYFTNIPIVISAENYERAFKGVHKPWMYLRAVENIGLQDSDIVLALDSDIMFTGLEYVQFVDKFIKLSPSNLNELNAKTIRTGETMSPCTYGVEKNCFCKQTIADSDHECHIEYEKIGNENEVYAESLHEYRTKPLFNFHDNPLQHLNSGTSIHRVWAMRKLFAAFHTFMVNNKPLDNKEWWCDQSVFAKLYLELRLWEIEEDYFRKQTDELRVMSNEYGLHAGLIGLNLRSELSVVVPASVEKEFELSSLLWTVSRNKEETMHLHYWKIIPFITETYKKLSHRTLKRLFKQRLLTRSYSNVHCITIAPPLLSIAPRHINGKNKPAKRVFPIIAHFAGLQKYKREKRAVSYMQWYVPMLFNSEEWKRGMEYIIPMPIKVLNSEYDRVAKIYGDVCIHNPFTDDILKI